MSKTIPGVPENISRADYIHLIESVGFDVDDVIELTFESGGIRASVAARNEQGHAYVGNLTAEGSNDFAIAKREVFIPVIDEVKA